MDDEQILCADCTKELILLKKHIGEKWELSELYFDKVYSCFFYDSVVKELVHSLKYNEYTHLAAYMADLIYNNIAWNRRVKYDYIIPVPLYSVKKRERGFNQAALLAKELAKRYNLQYNDKLLFRNRYTSTQTLKSHDERKSNVLSAFSVHKNNKYTELNILLVDDVITTGSTANSIAKVLKESIAKKVDVISFAFANVIN